MDHSKLFTLRIKTSRGNVLINAFDAPAFDANGEPSGGRYGHSRINMEVKLNGKIMFPLGALYCAVNGHTSTDGAAAKELVLTTVAMKPGDTDFEYFESYSPGQLAFASAVGDEISMVREDRYCDANGNLKACYRG